MLGKGGMGIVYKAHDRDLDDVVAIKTLRSEALSADPTLLDRFKQEIRLARRITHPNILRTHDLGETNGLRYLSMEFVKGITLKQMVEPGPAHPDARRAADRQADLRGLAAAHEVGVIHRDIKPQNIIIEPTGGLKVMDFGIARLTQERGHDRRRAPSSARPTTCRPSRPAAWTSTSAPTSTRPASSSTSSSPARSPSRGTRPLAVVLKHVQEKPPSPQAQESEDRSEDCGYHLEVHAEGPRRPLPDASTSSTRR